MSTLLNTLALIARATDDDNKDQNRYDDIECARPMRDLVGTGDPLFGDGTIDLHQLMVYVSGPCLFITLVSSAFLTWRHLHRYTSPQEQRQILRIINLPLAYCTFQFLALTFTLDYQYIEPIGAIYEGFAVAALFFLLLEYVAPDGTDREAYFANVPLKGRRGADKPGGSLVWFKTIWGAVLQYPLLKSILIMLQIITQYFGDFCESSFSIHHAHLWLTLADLLFVSASLFSVS